MVEYEYISDDEDFCDFLIKRKMNSSLKTTDYWLDRYNDYLLLSDKFNQKYDKELQECILKLKEIIK